MKVISSQRVGFNSKVLSMLVLTGLSVMLVYKGSHNLSPINLALFLTIICGVWLFTFFMVSELPDEVLDFDTYLMVRKSDCTIEIPLSSIISIRFKRIRTANFPLITLRLPVTTRFGNEISFVSAVGYEMSNGRLVCALERDLVKRKDCAKRSQAAQAEQQ